MLHTVQNIAVLVFIISVVFLTLIAILSIWDVFEPDVFWKSITTIAVVGFSSLLVIAAVKGVENHQKNNTPQS